VLMLPRGERSTLKMTNIGGPLSVKVLISLPGFIVSGELWLLSTNGRTS
jgi:hypothetical protein